jgi:hypothetical protein
MAECSVGRGGIQVEGTMEEKRCEKERFVERKNRRGNEVRRGREKNETRRIKKEARKSTERERERETERSCEQQWRK